MFAWTNKITIKCDVVKKTMLMIKEIKNLEKYVNKQVITGYNYQK